MIKHFGGGVVLAVALMLPGGGAVAQTAADDIKTEIESGLIATPQQRAQYYVKNKDWNKLLAHAQQWTTNFPGEAQAWQYLGTARKSLNKTTEALDAFVRAWELSDKKNFRIIEDIADSYTAVKEWNKAEDSYATAVSLRPRRATLWIKWADSILYSQQYYSWREDAARALKKALSLGYANDYERWRQYAVLLDEGEKKDIDEIYNAYRHVTRLKVKDVDAWRRLYEIETERQRPEEVEKIVGILFRIDKNDPYANLHYGLLALDGGQFPRARKHLEIALAAEHLSAARRSEIYMILGDIERPPDTALGYYKKAVENDLSNIPAWEQAIVMLRGLNRRQQAQAVEEQLLAVERKISRKEELTTADASELLGAQ